MQFVLSTIANWKSEKADSISITSILGEARQFTISLPSFDDYTSHINIYLAIDKYAFLSGDSSVSTQLYVHAISNNFDEEQYIKNEWSNIPDLVSTSLVSNLEPIIDTTSFTPPMSPNEITPQDAELRVQQWSHISEWVQYSCVFDVIAVPIVDFDITDTSLLYNCYFGMKQNQDGNFMPDLIIQKANTMGGLSYMDFAKPYPPYDSLMEKNSFGLLTI